MLLSFGFLLYEYLTHRLVNNKQIQIEGEPATKRFNTDDDSRKAIKLENASSHSLVHHNFYFLL